MDQSGCLDPSELLYDRFPSPPPSPLGRLQVNPEESYNNRERPRLPENGDALWAPRRHRHAPLISPFLFLS